MNSNHVPICPPRHPYWSNIPILSALIVCCNGARISVSFRFGAHVASDRDAEFVPRNSLASVSHLLQRGTPKVKRKKTVSCIDRKGVACVDAARAACRIPAERVASGGRLETRCICV